MYLKDTILQIYLEYVFHFSSVKHPNDGWCAEMESKIYVLVIDFGSSPIVWILNWRKMQTWKGENGLRGWPAWALGNSQPIFLNWLLLIREKGVEVPRRGQRVGIIDVQPSEGGGFLKQQRKPPAELPTPVRSTNWRTTGALSQAHIKLISGIQWLYT